MLGVIPARGGSKGVPGKNLRWVGGKPLVAWTIDAAGDAQAIDRLILSSDDPEIIECAATLGCEAPFVRPADLADDTASAVAVVRHVLDSLSERYDYVVLLQPTSPLRTSSDIDEAVRTCHATGAPACVSVTIARQNPWWMYSIGEQGRLRPLLDGVDTLPSRRQDLPSTYVLNGAVYVAASEWIMGGNDFLCPETVAYVMPGGRSLDVDDEMDFLLADLYLSGGDSRPAMRGSE